MALEYFGPVQFATLHNEVVGLGGHYRPLDITHHVGRSVAEYSISVTATLQPPTVIETEIQYTETPQDVFEERTVRTIKLEPGDSGQRVAASFQAWDRRPVSEAPTEDEEPPQIMKMRGIRRGWAIDRVRGGIADLLKVENELRDSDAQRR